MEKKNKIVLFFDYHLGFKLAKFLKYKKENVVGLVFDNKTKVPFSEDYKNKIKNLFKLQKYNIFEWSELNKKKF